MKKIQRMLAIGISLFLTLSVACVSACQGIDDIIPESYGEWDNNYIYRGNGKSKTTGEDYEQLVNSVEIDGKSHAVRACVDGKIEGDDMYMILACCETKPSVEVSYNPAGWDSDLGLTYCLVVYNIQDKTQKLLFTDQNITREDGEYFYRPKGIEGIFGERIVLRAYTQETEDIGDYLSLRNNQWFTVDLEGNLLDSTFEYLVESNYDSSWQWVSDEYLVSEVYEDDGIKLYYRDNQLSQPTLFYTHSRNAYNNPYGWSYVEQDGRKGVLIEEYYRVDSSSNYNKNILSKIKFYDFETNTTSSISVGQYAMFYMGSRYVKIYDYTTLDYYYTWAEKKTADVEVNNGVYRLAYDENGVRLEEVFDLTEKRNFTIYGIQEDKMVYLERWYDNPRGCDIFGGSEAEYWEYDFTSGEQKSIQFEDVRGLEDEYAAVYEQEKGVVVGDYIYFLHEETLQALMSAATTAYQLKRRNVTTGALEIMQLWHERKDYSSSSLTLKYCEDLWFTCGYYDSYNFYEFTVRNY